MARVEPFTIESRVRYFSWPMARRVTEVRVIRAQIMQLDLAPARWNRRKNNRIGARTVNSYLIEKVGPTSHLPTMGFVRNVWNQRQQ